MKNPVQYIGAASCRTPMLNKDKMAVGAREAQCVGLIMALYSSEVYVGPGQLVWDVLATVRRVAHQM